MVEKIVYTIVYHFANGEKYTKTFNINNDDNKEELSFNDKILNIVESAGTRGVWIVNKKYLNVKNYYCPSNIEKIEVIKGDIRYRDGYSRDNFEEVEGI